MTVPFGDLKRQTDGCRAALDEAVARVLSSGWYVLGRELEAFEREFAAWVGAPHCVGCASGTEAITLALWAHGLGAGDRVIAPANTCVPTASGILAAGCAMGLCDVREADALMDPAALDAVLKRRPARAVVPVHLYGNPADLDAIGEVAARHGAVVIDDAAQGHGAGINGRRIGGLGITTCWSFYPSKNLGALGDAGAVTTHDAGLAQRLRMLRNYGQEKRYFHSVPGINSRLDEMQAAILRVKLPLLDGWNDRRRAIAARYRAGITSPALRMPELLPGATGCHHLFPVFTTRRDDALAHFRGQGVECLIHYPVPLHLQKAHGFLALGRGEFPIAEALCGSELSLPMFPELADAEVDQVIEAANAWR